MIVKTGANYQAEGGYIEASITGGVVSVTTSDVDDFIIGGVENEPPGFIEIELINNTDRSLYVTSLTEENGILMLSSPTRANLPPSTSKKIKIPAFVNIPVRVNYTGEQTAIKINSEYLEFTENGPTSHLSIKNMPTDGTAITGTLYI